jgi:hypothetical protein
LVKYDPNGNVLWARQSIEPTNYCSGGGAGVAVDHHGNEYITGYILDTLVFGGHMIANNGENAFIVKYDNNGNALWGTATNNLSPNGIYGQSIAADTVGGVYISAGQGAPQTIIQVIYQSDTFTAKNTRDMTFLLKVDYSGNLIC